MGFWSGSPFRVRKEEYRSQQPFISRVIFMICGGLVNLFSIFFVMFALCDLQDASNSVAASAQVRDRVA